ncbi:hypothetical protein Mapa_016955 [Marchantia paleacea]|nr:hypothetical protein Mapa_016955 [Marchantia paleacea]
MPRTHDLLNSQSIAVGTEIGPSETFNQILTWPAGKTDGGICNLICLQCYIQLSRASLA